MDTFSVGDETFTRDELAALYTASFYLTNTLVLPEGHPPTPAQMAQLKIANVLGEDVPEAALQDVQRAMDSVRQKSLERAEARQRADAVKSAAEARSQKAGS